MVATLRAAAVPYAERLEYGVQVIGSRPYMDNVQADRYVWIKTQKAYYYNTETEEIREKENL